MDQAERALRESWVLYRQHIGGPLTVGWNDLPHHRREAWRVVTAPFLATGKNTVPAASEDAA